MVYLDFVVASALPFIVMIIYNIMIIIKLVQVSIKRRTMNVTNSGPNIYQLTFTLLTVSFTYMLLTSPSAILVLGWDYFGINSGHSHELILMWRSIAKVNMNSTFNFIQYACIGPSFRMQSKNMLKKIAKYFKVSRCKLPHVCKFKLTQNTSNIEMNNI